MEDIDLLMPATKVKAPVGGRKKTAKAKKQATIRPRSDGRMRAPRVLRPENEKDEEYIKFRERNNAQSRERQRAEKKELILRLNYALARISELEEKIKHLR